MMTIPDLPHTVQRTVIINAKPDVVFRFFTDTERWAKWWGAGSTIEARVGGKVYICHPNGVESSGEILEMRHPDRIVFTYGFASGEPMPAGSSRVTISLEPGESGTRLHLLHEFAEPRPCDEHVQGWRFQLSLFANVVANEVYADAAAAVDAWFAAWTVRDDKERDEALARLVTPGISFLDRFSLLDGIADLSVHINASQRFMPGIVLRRKGTPRQCQGTVISDWMAVGPDDKDRMSGTNVFTLTPDGLIGSVIGFANPSPTS
jgi:uncharacterized protein YndB with AHSA1/START domain